MEEADIILNLLKKGEKKGLEMLFRKFYSPLVVYACKFLKEQTEAEDVVQEVFIKFWKRDQFTDIQDYLRSYLYQSVHNACLNRLALRKGHICSGLEYARNLAEEEIPDEKERLDYLQEIYQEIENLPEKTRMVFQSVILEGKRYKQVAEEQNISINTVKTLLSRALSALRNHLSNSAFIFLFSFFRK